MHLSSDHSFNHPVESLQRNNSCIWRALKKWYPMHANPIVDTEITNGWLNRAQSLPLLSYSLTISDNLFILFLSGELISNSNSNRMTLIDNNNSYESSPLRIEWNRNYSLYSYDLSIVNNPTTTQQPPSANAYEPRKFVWEIITQVPGTQQLSHFNSNWHWARSLSLSNLTLYLRHATTVFGVTTALMLLLPVHDL